MKLTCLIVDDEPLAIQLMKTHISKIDNLLLVDICTNAIEARRILSEKSIDLMFLDVQMPQMTGFELLHTLSNPPAVIITSAYRDYAYEGYEFDVIDFLLKPIFFERLEKAVYKVFARKGINTTVENNTRSSAVQYDNLDTAYMYFKVDREMVKVMLKDILWIESMKDYVKIKTLTQGQLVTYQRISYLDEKMPEEFFLRIHRSYIVNKRHIASFSATGVTIATKVLPVGRLYKAEVLKAFQKDIKG